jgi:aminopeptidase YwaD
MSPPPRARALALLSLIVAAASSVAAIFAVGQAPAQAAPDAPASVLSAPSVARAAVPVLANETAPAFSGDAAHAHVRALSESIGSRVAGTENQLRAAEYLAEQLRSYGYETRLQPFSVSSYDDRGSSVTVGDQSLAAATLQYSVGGDVVAEVVDAGLGRPGELAGAGVAGKIALIERGELRFQEKVANAARAGAVGVIVYNHQPGAITGSLAESSTIPAALISQADGRALADRLGGAPVTARLTVDASVESRLAQNVIATRQGGPQTVVIGGHYDSVQAGPGANDNASGTSVVLEVARVMAGRPSPYTLTFALFDAEEIGLLGSAHMVAQMSPEELRSIRAMINLDMVGVGTMPQLGGSEELIRLGQAISAGLGQQAGAIGQVGGGSDHASFMRVGVPAVFVYRSNDPNYHSPNDRAEFVEPAHLAYAGGLVLGLLDALASGR